MRWVLSHGHLRFSSDHVPVSLLLRIEARVVQLLRQPQLDA